MKYPNVDIDLYCVKKLIINTVINPNCIKSVISEIKWHWQQKPGEKESIVIFCFFQLDTAGLELMHRINSIFQADT